jgi:hypothetical protein
MANGRDAQIQGIVSKLAEDSEFLELDPSSQDRIISEIAQQRFGSIPKTESLLQRGIKSATENFPPFSGQAENIANALPATGQTSGSVAGFLGGAKIARPNQGQIFGGTVGRAAGEIGRQTINVGLNPENVSATDVATSGPLGLFSKEEFDPKKLGQETLTAAGTETAGAGLSKLLGAIFSGTAGKFFRGQTGKRFGEAFEKVTSSGVKTSVSPVKARVVSRLDELLSEVPITPSKNRLLKSAVGDIFEKIESKGSSATAKDFFRAKKRMDEVLKTIGVFGKKGKKGTPVDFDAGEAGLQIRDIFSEELQKLANQVSPKVGKELASSSAAFAKSAREFPPGKMGIGGIVPEIGRAGAFFKAASGDFPGALAALAGAEAAEARGLPPLVFGIGQTVSKTAPTGIAELISRSQR